MSDDETPRGNAPLPWSSPAGAPTPPPYQGDPRFGTPPPVQPAPVPSQPYAAPGYPSPGPAAAGSQPQPPYYQPYQPPQPAPQVPAAQPVAGYSPAQPHPSAPQYQQYQQGPGQPYPGAGPQTTTGYPPPGYQPGPGYPMAMSPAGSPRSIKGLGTATLVLGAVLVFGDVLRALTSVSAEHAYERYRLTGSGLDVSGPYILAELFGYTAIPLFIVGSLWLMHARANAAALAPQRMHRSAVWCWLGWIVPIVAFWFPKQILDDSWKVTAEAAGVSAASKPRSTSLMWGLWIAYWAMFWVAAMVNGAGHSSMAYQQGAYDQQTNGVSFNAFAQHVHPGVEVLLAIVAIAAFAAWVPVVRGVTSAQENLRARYAGTSAAGTGHPQY